jgi:DNA-binding SARP family transcriptional activator/ABC-type branched-subunit amino acid transport system substrate-binding protein
VLAILLLRAGEVVSVDRLVDELWGESPPDDAASALQQHVSRLRRVLAPDDVLLTRPPGYFVQLGDGELDLHEFEQRCQEGRALLEDGRPAEASDALRRGLDLWRGRPLADLEQQPFARDAIARLDELWLEAIESRIEADMALGRHGELVAELHALVRRHPLRERLRGQLMLALYRSGRQADALEAFAEGRRTLVDELGLEPGPELRRLHQAILDHDPALEPGQRPSTRPDRASSARRLPAVAAAALLVLAAILATILLTGDDGAERPRPDGGELVAVNVATGAVERRLPAGRTPASVAGIAGGRLWVVDGDARTLLAIDPGTGDAEALATGATPTSVAVAGNGVWVANGRPSATAQVVGPVATQVIRLDPATRTQRASLDLPSAPGAVSNTAGNSIAVSPGAVWAVTASGSVVRIDPQSAAITASTTGVNAVAVAAGPAGVWALRSDNAVVLLDERTAGVRRLVRLPTDAASALAVGATAAWVTSSVDGTLWRIGRDGVLGSVAVGSGARAIAAGATRIWIANPIAGTVTAVDPRSMRVVRTVRVGGIPRSLTIAGDVLWTAVAGAGETTTSSRAAGVTPLPSSICEPVIAGGGRADLLITSDLPLQGGIRVTATQMAHAITFVLREHGFRAGRFRVAYQSCDDSVARTGLFDEDKCAANARAYGANRDVVAVIGTLNSPCAVAALPELNRARGGPLAMVSPLNSFVGLTRRALGVSARLQASLYPTGRRNYLRVYPTDDLQGAALALFARDRGRRSAYVLDDGQPGYGKLMAGGFQTAATRLGLRIAGHATWDPQARSYAGLGRRVAASGAQAVFVGGLLDSNAARVVRDLRAAVGPDVDVLAPDGLTPLPLLSRAAGRAARGVFVSLGGLITERLPAAGTAFVRRFARAQTGDEIEPAAVYAAQATEVVLDAIARSDGTRRSVLDELFRTRVRGGLLGDFSFDAHGDISESPVTIMRVGGGGSALRIASVDGGTVARISRPRVSLVTTAE